MARPVRAPHGGTTKAGMAGMELGLATAVAGKLSRAKKAYKSDGGKNTQDIPSVKGIR